MNATANTTATTPTATDFDFFEGRQTESKARPQITIRRGGLIVLTSAAVAMLGEKAQAVQLAYNRKSGAVGIRAAAEDVPGGYRLRAPVKGPSRLIGGKRFFEHHGLSVRQARTFTATDFGNGIVGFILKVEAPVEVATEAMVPVVEIQPAAATAARKTRKAA